MPDHIDLLVRCDPRFGVHHLVTRIKDVNSRLLHQEYPALKSCLPSLWTNFSYVATTDGAPLEQVKRYIENQKRSER